MSNNSFFSVMMIASVLGICFFVWLAFDLEKADKLKELQEIEQEEEQLHKLRRARLENAILRHRLKQPLPSWPLDTSALFRRREFIYINPDSLDYER